jgi:hypothetical protein
VDIKDAAEIVRPSPALERPLRHQSDAALAIAIVALRHVAHERAAREALHRIRILVPQAFEQ